ncbi:MAG TPA: hypothetical protein VI006_16365 [Solirubrobacteraceae bacterium]
MTHMHGRDPRLRQPPLGEQLAQPAGVLAIGLGAPLAPAQRARLDRLGQMRHRARGDQRVTDKQPPGAGLHRDIDLARIEALDPAGDGRRRGVNPTAAHLPRARVERVERDLPAMHIKPGYDRHQGLL